MIIDIVAILAFVMSGFNIFFYLKFHKQNIFYNKEKDKEKFLSGFKQDLQKLKSDVLELYSIRKKIKFVDKEELLYILEYKYSKQIILKYLNNNIYEQFMDLKIKTDESLNQVAYKQDYSFIDFVVKNINLLFDNINKITSEQ